ncbi:MAG: cell division protein FtsA [Chloroflexi bacterium]|nr:cell division protein FtsA [Chloroflexota bacterium]
MADATIITAIDVGTTKICTIVGKKTGPTNLQVLAYSIVPCDGLKKGNVEDVTATETAIRASIVEVERKTGLSIQSAYIGVTGTHVAFENRLDTLNWAGKRGVITNEDLERVPQKVASESQASGRKVIHAIPMSYSVDGKEGIRSPIGMHTTELKVETHVVTAASYVISSLMDAVEKAGLRIESLVLEPLASSLAVLTQEEREQGVGLIDIGGGTTDVVVFKNGSIQYTAVLPVGGYQFTNDISLTYDTSYHAAEEVKLKYAHTEPNDVHPNDEISLPVLGRQTELKVPLRDIRQLTRERAQELVRLIKVKLEDAGIDDITDMQLVITGGASALPGLKELLQRSLTRHVRIGVPDGGGNLPDELKAPAFATSTGILLWAAEQHKPETARTTNGASNGAKNGGSGVVSRFARQVRGLLS